MKPKQNSWSTSNRARMSHHYFTKYDIKSFLTTNDGSKSGSLRLKSLVYHMLFKYGTFAYETSVRFGNGIY